MSLWSEINRVPHRLGWIDAGGIRTRYLDAGDASAERPTVLFLHGINGHLEVFLRNIAAHAADFRVLAIDLVGHGYSDKPADRSYEIEGYVDQVLAFLDAMSIDRASLVGTSLGGWIVARIASSAPDRVASLSLVSSGGLTTYANVMKSLRDLGTQAAADDREAVRQRMAFVIKDPANITEELIDLRAAIYAQPDYQRNVPNLFCLQDPDVRARNLLTVEELGRIAVPSIVVWTRDDPTATVADGKRYADAIPGARFEVFEESSHMPQYEEPGKFNTLHAAFLREVVG